ncbi:class I SAM-dependent methyltransferase [Aquirufa regiilacus]
MGEETKAHWENIYKTKQPNEVGWTQNVPSASLAFIHQLNVPKAAKIIDIGGGDSNLVDFLLAEGYTNLSVLDISEAAILRAQKRLGVDASKVHWIVCDILDFEPEESYAVWHDRASFHFLLDTDKIEKYLNTVKKAVDGSVIIGTFSVDGPKKCSGLDVKQYDEKGLKATLAQIDFKSVECLREDHITPAGVVQNYVFCSFTNQ